MAVIFQVSGLDDWVDGLIGDTIYSLFLKMAELMNVDNRSIYKDSLTYPERSN